MSHDVPTRTGPDQHSPGFHRRDFLKGSGAAVAATAMATAGDDARAQVAPKKISTSAPQKIKLNVNGQERELTVEPRVTLMDALRNDLNLTACKDVCDRAVCGACTVHIDGKPVLACTRLAIEFTGQKIVTAEALMTPTKTDAVIDAFVKHDGMQCGFCTPGFVMAVRGFCNSHPNATVDDCRKGLGGNICRCGTYDSVLKAAYEVAQTKKGGA
ncbi:MAG: (2Fe-2S)-binding protein [Planctomycetaceae bacterium]|nr:(2Fe-2S)-binding protein [Planctomycetaceae bacterium]